MIISPQKKIDAALIPLQRCVKNKEEMGFVRKECALTLSQWKLPGISSIIIDAMMQVDPESRYWMAYALSTLDQPQAIAQLESLRNDPDPLLSIAVRQWLED